MRNKCEISLDEIIKAEHRFRCQEGQNQKHENGLDRNIRPGVQWRLDNARKVSWGHAIAAGLNDEKLVKVRATDLLGHISNKSPARLILSNLHDRVDEKTLRELFEDVGPIKTFAVHYNYNGRPLGSALIIFEHQEDAITALNKFNGAWFHGRVLNIEIAEESTIRMKATNKYRMEKRKVTITSYNQIKFPKKYYKILKKQTAKELDAELDRYNAARPAKTEVSS